MTSVLGDRIAQSTYNNPYGAVVMQSSLNNAGGRTTVSRPGDTPDSYGYGQDPLPTDGRATESPLGFPGDSAPGGFTNAATGEHGDTLETTPGNPSIVDGITSWLADVGPRVGTFIVGATLVVLAFYLLTRTPAPAQLIVTPAPTPGGKKSAAKPATPLLTKS